MTLPASPRPVVLCVLDGWGEGADNADNAIARAKAPHFAHWSQDVPHARLDASGEAVGLPDGQMGNSEVGHMTIGAGRVIRMDLPRIDHAIADGSFATNPTLEAFITKLKRVGGACHLLGLMSPGGVHSHQRHLAVAAILIAQHGVPVWVHAFLDGRDTPPKSAVGFVNEFLSDVAGYNVRIGTISGRYYAMDRDKRWERVERAFKAIVSAEGNHARDPIAAIDASYAAGVTDEFLEPVVLNGYPGFKDDDGLFMGNFRADRARELLHAFLLPEFSGFVPARRPVVAAATGMSDYEERLRPHITALFPPNEPEHTLGDVVAAAGLKQLRVAETEKYAHVTFFLSGGREATVPGEDRILIPSPKVATYDLQPQMSAPAVTDALVTAIDSGTYDLIVVNYANPDMVGHTGVMSAAITAVETIDSCLDRVVQAVTGAGGAMLITADHGNIEMMKDPVTHQPHTAHTTNLVPLLLIESRATASTRLEDGTLADIAPTVLDLMGLPQPAEMTGRSLVVHDHDQVQRRALV